jgi:hypothetical protein
VVLRHFGGGGCRGGREELDPLNPMRLWGNGRRDTGYQWRPAVRCRSPRFSKLGWHAIESPLHVTCDLL